VPVATGYHKPVFFPVQSFASLRKVAVVKL
jgi:hypothetical protein